MVREAAKKFFWSIKFIVCDNDQSSYYIVFGYDLLIVYLDGNDKSSYYIVCGYDWLIVYLDGNDKSSYYIVYGNDQSSN